MLDTKDILEATEGKLLKGKAESGFSAVSTDTRTIKQGALFIAIKGPNFDGHNFIEEAKARGALGVIVNEGSNAALDGLVIIEVKDTVKAFRPGHRARA